MRRVADIDLNIRLLGYPTAAAWATLTDVAGMIPVPGPELRNLGPPPWRGHAEHQHPSIRMEGADSEVLIAAVISFEIRFSCTGCFRLHSRMLNR
jgi:hypothetical protein